MVTLVTMVTDGAGYPGYMTDFDRQPIVTRDRVKKSRDCARKSHG